MLFSLRVKTGLATIPIQAGIVTVVFIRSPLSALSCDENGSPSIPLQALNRSPLRRQLGPPLHIYRIAIRETSTA
jgi:hypothetical protein